jgi:hypothetical protein
MKFSLSTVLALLTPLLIASSCSSESTSPTPTPDPSVWQVLSKDTATSAPAANGIVTASMFFKNTSSTERKFLFRHTVLEAAPGHTPQFCVGELCLDLRFFDPSMADPFIIAPGAQDEAKLQVITENQPGSTTVRIVLYDVDNPKDSLVYTARMTATP